MLRLFAFHFFSGGILSAQGFLKQASRIFAFLTAVLLLWPTACGKGSRTVVAPPPPQASQTLPSPHKTCPGGGYISIKTLAGQQQYVAPHTAHSSSVAYTAGQNLIANGQVQFPPQGTQVIIEGLAPPAEGSLFAATCSKKALYFSCQATATHIRYASRGFRCNSHALLREQVSAPPAPSAEASAEFKVEAWVSTGEPQSSLFSSQPEEMNGVEILPQGALNIHIWGRTPVGPCPVGFQC